MAALTAAQRKREERRRDKAAGLKGWKANIDDSTRNGLKRLTTAYGTASQTETFIKLITDALHQLDTPQPSAIPIIAQETRDSVRNAEWPVVLEVTDGAFT